MADLSRGSRAARAVKARDAARPYPPSFIDRFLDAIDRLPRPFWLPYLVLFLLFALLNHASAWEDGSIPAFRFNSLLLVFPLWIWAPPAIMTFLNTVDLRRYYCRDSLDWNGGQVISVGITPMPRYHQVPGDCLLDP